MYLNFKEKQLRSLIIRLITQFQNKFTPIIYLLNKENDNSIDPCRVSIEEEGMFESKICKRVSRSNWSLTK